MRTGMSWLDVKLGLRMLVRYPGLSLAGGLGMAVVIACGTAAAIFDAVVNGGLPFEDGDRVVAIENWDTISNDADSRALHDFVVWRDELKTIQDIGAYRLVRRNVTNATALGASPLAEPVRIAEISAAAFQLARVPPLLGRYLVRADEREGAPPVVVIRHDEWQRRFEGDPNVVGRTLQFGDTTVTVVGVMPGDFGFPVNERFWTPLRLKPSEYPRGRGPEIYVFGRLAAGADLAAAQAELTTIGQRAAIDFPDTNARLRPRVVRYTEWYFAGMHTGAILLLRTLVVLLLGVVCANVAVLVYARTATRQVEIAVRTALGASRRRIVGQMFVEGLALSSAAAAVGLAIASVARGQFDALVRQAAPFWVDASLTSGTVLAYVLALTVLGAAIVGVMPGLQATSRRAQTGLQHAAASLSGWRIGRTYTFLIVVQVALAVAMLPLAITATWTSIRYAMADPAFPAHEFLVAHIGMDGELPPSAAAETAALGAEASAKAARFRDRRAELERRLESEPGVSDVIFLTRVPGGESRARVEVEGGRTREVYVAEIGADFFEAFDITIVAGRPFESGDLNASSQRVVVNRTFAEKIVGGNAVGRRVRRTGLPAEASAKVDPWLEIIGVIDDFPASPVEANADQARVYYPLARGDTRFDVLALRLRGVTPTAFASRLREIMTALDRDLQLRETRSMDALLREQQFEVRIAAWSIGLLTTSVLLLSATGLYALMAFTVARRRREIGIRLALGANPRRILGSIMARSFGQLAIGAVVGGTIAALLDVAGEGELTGGMGLPMLPAVAAFVLLVGLIAAAGPARRGLRIQPTEALREE